MYQTVRRPEKSASSSDSHVLYTCVRRDGVQDLSALCWINTPRAVERVLLRTQRSCVCVRQKRPTVEAKETYCRGKRDLL
jgi:hypothetical protein